MSIRAIMLAMLLLLGFGGAAFAVQPDEKLADPALEARARALSAGFRCLVCQNQSIDDSDADLARDLRVLIRERLTAGDSDTQVTEYVVARYGDYVLLKPRFTASTLALWLLPFLVLLCGVVVIVRRRQAAPATEAPLSPEELEKLKQL